MKKLSSLFILSLSAFSLISCGCSKNSEPIERKDADPESEEEEIDYSKYKSVNDLNEENLKLFPKIYVHHLQELNSFKAITKGNTVAKVLFIETVQSIDVTTIKGDYSYMKNESHSSIVNTSHEVYYHDKKALYADNGESEYHLETMDNYLSKYGTYPFENSIEGYSISNKAIKTVTKLESEENHKFKVEFDPVEATNNVKIQMKQFGGLDNYPSFSGIEMTFTIKSDFTPITIELSSSYVATKMMQSDCSQNYTVTFSNFNETIEVPNLDNIKDKFN